MYLSPLPIKRRPIEYKSPVEVAVVLGEGVSFDVHTVLEGVDEPAGTGDAGVAVVVVLVVVVVVAVVVVLVVVVVVVVVDVPVAGSNVASNSSKDSERASQRRV